MSATKNWMMSVEEAFWEQVEDIVKSSKSGQQACERAVSLAKPMVPYIDALDIEEGVCEIWNDVWSTQYA